MVVPSGEDAAACPLCGGRASEPALTGYDRLQARERDYTYVRCRGCGLLHLSPLPAEDEIPGFYPNGYAPHGASGGRNRDKWINRLATRWYYATDSVERPAAGRALFRLLDRRVMRDIRPPRGANRVLDVGCGAGGLLARYRALGWTVRGVEPSENGVRSARERGLDVHLGTVFDAPFDDEERFDLVLLSHVIEHVRQPVKLLARCAELLAPGGLLVLTTPNAAGFGLRRFRSCWSWLDAPRHLMLFDPSTVRLLAERAGLRAARVLTPALPRLIEESAHLRETQGAELPADLTERRRLVEGAPPRRRYRRERLTLAPAAHLAALGGGGDLLEAELVHA